MISISKPARCLIPLVLAIPVLGIGLGFTHTAFAGTEPPHWTYGGTANPTEWGELSPDFAQCELGQDQSPINIQDAMAGTPAAITFNYAPVPLMITNNGHTIQVNYAEGSTVTIDGEVYTLAQFHFHTPSEHQINGKAAAMELHLVHRNAEGKLAVVGVMIEAGTTNPSLDKIWQHIPTVGTSEEVKGLTINAADFLPDDISYYSYSGSLTTPPCSEGVSWTVLTTPIQFSEQQIEAFETLYPVNARPIQATHDRRIEVHH